MLVRITDACEERCTHCMVSGNPDGLHMTNETLDKVLLFLSRARPNTVIVSGGEPLLHPEWQEILESILYEVPYMAVLSNGSFIKNPTKVDIVRNLIKKGIAFQVRTHPTFYPNYQETMRQAPVLRGIGCEVYDDEIDQLVRSGRAKTAHLDLPSVPCPCANTVLVAKQSDYLSWIPRLEQAGRFCTPMISVDGKIYPGETAECVSLGCVGDSTEDLHGVARQLHPRECNRCSGWARLMEKYPKAVDIFNTLKHKSMF